MRFNVENDVLTVYLEGRIDSVSSPAVDSEICAIIAQNTFSKIILDAEKLEYISSAGLRVVLKIRKENPSLSVKNVSSDVYEIFEMTGFSEMIEIEKAYRTISVDGCKIIGKGAKGTVYRYNDDTIVKVYKSPDCLPDIKRERELARRAFILGVPTVISYDIVKVGDAYGSVFELLNAKSFSQLIAEDPDNVDKYADLAASLLRKIHSTEVLPSDMPPVKSYISEAWVDMIRDVISADTYNKLKALVEAVPEPLKMLHCDYHTNNIMMQNGETMIIDMDTLSYGHPIFELATICSAFITLGCVDNTVVENFLSMPFALATKFWDIFLRKYLGTDDKDRINEVDDKVKLLSYVRLVRHTLRHGEKGSELYNKNIEVGIQNIESLLKTVNTLEF
ncbi:MAG: anti-sigma factor antagonist [Clostridia bacterium]|nr:anti-sigma factor antagonist [Clostridia bacterium]